MQETETFVSLLFNLPHWEFELLVSVVFAFLEGLVLLPLYRRWNKHHKEDDTAILALEKRVKELEKYA